ncbi:MAG: hypothetical protein ACXAB4_05910, partial [Candidatus Hodarchaeales archaeon]
MAKLGVHSQLARPRKYLLRSLIGVSLLIFALGWFFQFQYRLEESKVIDTTSRGGIERLFGNFGGGHTYLASFEAEQVDPDEHRATNFEMLVFFNVTDSASGELIISEHFYLSHAASSKDIEFHIDPGTTIEIMIELYFGHPFVHPAIRGVEARVVVYQDQPVFSEFERFLTFLGFATGLSIAAFFFPMWLYKGGKGFFLVYAKAVCVAKFGRQIQCQFDLRLLPDTSEKEYLRVQNLQPTLLDQIEVQDRGVGYGFSISGCCPITLNDHFTNDHAKLVLFQKKFA